MTNRKTYIIRGSAAFTEMKIDAWTADEAVECFARNMDLVVVAADTIKCETPYMNVTLGNGKHYIIFEAVK